MFGLTFLLIIGAGAGLTSGVTPTLHSVCRPLHPCGVPPRVVRPLVALSVWRSPASAFSLEYDGSLFGIAAQSGVGVSLGIRFKDGTSGLVIIRAQPGTRRARRSEAASTRSAERSPSWPATPPGRPAPRGGRRVSLRQRRGLQGRSGRTTGGEPIRGGGDRVRRRERRHDHGDGRRAGVAQWPTERSLFARRSGHQQRQVAGWSIVIARRTTPARLAAALIAVLGVSLAVLALQRAAGAPSAGARS